MLIQRETGGRDILDLRLPTLTEPVRSFGAEAVTIRDEAEVEEGIVRAFAVKTPVVIHCLTSAIQMSAWSRYTPFPDASVEHSYRRRPRLHLAGYRSKVAKTALSPVI
jgi:hypothetical protein